MLKSIALPETLADAIKFFADKEMAHGFMVQLRWPNGVACPRCGCPEVSYLSTRMIWKCKGCMKQFSLKVGTIFEDSPIGLDKWLPALWMLANCRNGVSSYEVARTLGVTQKTGWFMLHRIRLAMQSGSFEKTHGTVEIDETFVGGLAKHMHGKRKKRMLKGKTSGQSGKVGVIGAVKRGTEKHSSRVHARVLTSTHARPYARMAEETVLPGSTVYTDGGYLLEGGRLEGYIRDVVNHAAKEYVRGEVHTNSVENFWSLLKRSLKGTYISVDPFHLFRYVNEQVFRFNVRGQKDGQRFRDVANLIVGKRITYAELIGANLDPATT